MGTRHGAIERARAFFDRGGFRDLLAGLVAIPSTSQDRQHQPELARYLESAIRPWLLRLGFVVEVFPNPELEFGPILLAQRVEDAAAPALLTYGHGDTVRGLDEEWRP
ncbi:MAG: M20 peptidase family dipeptidase, partial [Acetobacteraceae bacterium]